ncbi:MAG: hypothetical protein JWQ08_248, partial [Deinococcus sp.]|nr:hypothetical protein [Deinococcus sp.]
MARFSQNAFDGLAGQSAVELTVMVRFEVLHHCTDVSGTLTDRFPNDGFQRFGRELPCPEFCLSLTLGFGGLRVKGLQHR